ncbi:hypothetical protein EJ08DRAFT_42667 [Tothia fuscella]|uniref:Uncharacterized protein n=1 Tax=Tothia fuscella TaxID=1048955 RepID=A0A9P4TTE9_9PEZI|nr:hypothetical protein EJ08DRAFT_42667 [Tothia fuscella]
MLDYGNSDYFVVTMHLEADFTQHVISVARHFPFPLTRHSYSLICTQHNLMHTSSFFSGFPYKISTLDKPIRSQNAAPTIPACKLNPKQYPQRSRPHILNPSAMLGLAPWTVERTLGHVQQKLTRNVADDIVNIRAKGFVDRGMSLH